MSLPKLTESIVRAGATPESFARGEDYYQNGAISNTVVQGGLLIGDCEGTYAPYYRVQVELDEAGICSATCTCPYDFGGYCKHIVALLLTYVHHPKQFAARQEPDDLLADLDRDDLLALLSRLLRERPELYDWIEVAIAAPTASGKSGKARRKKVDTQAYRRQVRNILHSLDGMRASEAYWHVGGLANELQGVADNAMKFLDAGDADTALEILLALIEEAYDSVEYIDDSDGYLGGFFNELGQPLAEAILSLDLSAVEREKLVKRLKKLSDYLDDYGLEGGLELAVEAAPLGWDAPDHPPAQLATHAIRFAEDNEYDDELDKEDFDDEDWGADTGEIWYGSAAGDLTEAKLNVLDRQGRVDEYLALCQATERHRRYALKLCDLKRVPEAMTFARKHFTSAQDALALAQKLREEKHVAEALSIGERGLTLSGSKVDLGEWLAPIEEAQGRTKEALQAWLGAFPEQPSLDTYKTIKRLAGRTWTRLRPKIMSMLNKFYDKGPLAEVLLFEQEWDEAIKVAERREVWYGVIETVADGVLAHRPEWVARRSVKQAERLMVEPKSKNYPIAASWLKRAKKAYAHLGQTREWQAYLNKIKEQYKRRPALQKQLRQL